MLELASEVVQVAGRKAHSVGGMVTLAAGCAVSVKGVASRDVASGHEAFSSVDSAAGPVGIPVREGQVVYLLSQCNLSTALGSLAMGGRGFQFTGQFAESQSII